MEKGTLTMTRLAGAISLSYLVKNNEMKEDRRGVRPQWPEPTYTREEVEIVRGPRQGIDRPMTLSDPMKGRRFWPLDNDVDAMDVWISHCVGFL